MQTKCHNAAQVLQQISKTVLWFFQLKLWNLKNKAKQGSSQEAGRNEGILRVNRPAQGMEAAPKIACAGTMALSILCAQQL